MLSVRRKLRSTARCHPQLPPGCAALLPAPRLPQAPALAAGRALFVGAPQGVVCLHSAMAGP